MPHMIYTSKPKTGKGKLAWERFERDRGKPPYSVEYSPNYQYELKGWICQYYPPNTDIPLQREKVTHTFYQSSELS